MNFFFVLFFLVFIPLFSQSIKTVPNTKSTVGKKESADTTKKEIPVPKDLYSVEDYGDIEKKIQTWSLEEIEAYATANNPLYLAEKQNIGMARGDLITAALYRNPVVAYQQQFIPMNIRETGTNYGPTAGTSGGGFQVFQQQIPGGAGGLQEIAPSVSWETDFGIIRNQKIKVASQGFQAQIAQFADFDRLFRLRLRQNYWLHLYITELIDFQKEFYENYNDLLELNKFRADKGDIAVLEYDRLQLERIRIEKEIGRASCRERV